MNKKKNIILLIIPVLILIFIYDCETGIEPSPNPGMIRVTLQANTNDTITYINQDTVYSDPRDSVNIKIFQGRIYQDSFFSLLYQNPKEYLQEDHQYNLFRRENGVYKEYTIFECLLPPEKYNNLVFGIDADFMLLTHGFFSGGIGIPMESNPDSSLLREFEVEMDIEEDRILEIKLIIDLFDSVRRQKDIFKFEPKIQVKSVEDAGPY